MSLQFNNLQGVSGFSISDSLCRAEGDVLVEDVVAVLGRGLQGPVPVASLGVHVQRWRQVNACQLDKKRVEFSKQFSNYSITSPNSHLSIKASD